MEMKITQLETDLPQGGSLGAATLTNYYFF
jgi:hypothetical protein